MSDQHILTLASGLKAVRDVVLELNTEVERLRQKIDPEGQPMNEQSRTVPNELPRPQGRVLTFTERYSRLQDKPS